MLLSHLEPLPHLTSTTLSPFPSFLHYLPSRQPSYHLLSKPPLVRTHAGLGIPLLCSPCASSYCSTCRTLYNSSFACLFLRLKVDCKLFSQELNWTSLKYLGFDCTVTKVIYLPHLPQQRINFCSTIVSNLVTVNNVLSISKVRGSLFPMALAPKFIHYYVEHFSWFLLNVIVNERK